MRRRGSGLAQMKRVDEPVPQEAVRQVDIQQIGADESQDCDRDQRNDHELPAEAVEHLRTRHQSRVQILPVNLTEGLDHMRQTAKIKAELIEAERDFIYELLRDGKITDEARRRIEYELDLEEASVANRATDGGGWM